MIQAHLKTIDTFRGLSRQRKSENIGYGYSDGPMVSIKEAACQRRIDLAITLPAHLKQVDKKIIIPINRALGLPVQGQGDGSTWLNHLRFDPIAGQADRRAKVSL